MHKIDPEACQFCGACQSACSVEAVFHPAGKNYYEINSCELEDDSWEEEEDEDE